MWIKITTIGILAIGFVFVVSNQTSDTDVAPTQTASVVQQVESLATTSNIQPTEPIVENDITELEQKTIKPEPHQSEPEVELPVSKAVVTTEIVEITEEKEEKLTEINKEEVVEALSEETPDIPTKSKPFAYKQEWTDAVVNLICTRNGELVGSGSGVIVDSRGIILTNAHVGFNFLFDDLHGSGFYKCSLRTGTPPYTWYSAKLMHIPKAYIDFTMTRLFAYNDDGVVYGLDDYAFLAITGRTNGTEGLSSYPTLVPQTEELYTVGENVYLAGYPAGLLGGEAILKNLYPVSSPSKIIGIEDIQEETNTVLVFDGSIAGQPGSSGGAVINADGKLIAIPTFTDERFVKNTDLNTLNAITVAYINQSLRSDIGLDLFQFINQDNPAEIANTFMQETGEQYACDIYNKKREGLQAFYVSGVKCD